MKRSREEEAHSILSKIGGSEYANQEVEDIKVTLKGKQQSNSFTALLERRFYKILGLAAR